MCCRYYMELSPELRPYIEAADRSPLKEKLVDRLARPLVSSGEVRPTDLVPVLAPSAKAHKPSVFPMQWGFSLPDRRNAVFNARVESAKDKPTFQRSWKERRCVVPASYYYEWQHLPASDGRTRPGEKYALQPRGSTVAYLAGLYRIEELEGFKIPVFTILTRPASEELRFLHDRMPLILPKEDIPRWLDPAAKPEELVPHAVTDLIYEQGSLAI